MAAPKKKSTKSANPRLTPDGIMQLGLGFWGSKTLLSAIELGLFTELAKGPVGQLLRHDLCRSPEAPPVPFGHERHQHGLSDRDCEEVPVEAVQDVH